jgi:hypothetical protein
MEVIYLIKFKNKIYFIFIILIWLFVASVLMNLVEKMF